MKPFHWIVVGVSLFGCASAPSTPDWVNGKSAKYPDNQYLVGRGQADAQEDARNRARADLAKILEVGVSAKSSDVTSFSSGAEGAKTESQVSRSIVTRTEQIVRGIQIPETWQDPQTKSTYALAVLPRSQAAAAAGELSSGRRVLDVIQGDAVPQTFIPRLIRLYRQGRFPFDRLVKFYDFADINTAIADEKSGKTIKAVLRISPPSPARC